MGIIIKAGDDVAIDMSEYSPFSGDFGSADITSFTSTKIVGYAYGSRIEIRGSGFKADSAGYLASGTINSISQTYGGELELSVSGFSVTVKQLVKVLSTGYTWDERDLVKQMMSGNDKVYGGNYEDVLYGEAGNDFLSGRGGDDRLFGHAGKDILYGGAGADRLAGGSGADTFVFTKISNSNASKGIDKIYDFSRSQGDKIDLKGIDANTKISDDQGFKFIEDQKFHNKAGELRYEKKNGDTYIYADVNGDGNADFAVKFDDPITFLKGDFIL
ncbi:calcium-binding protein [Shinella sp.]|uniref:calcium-binding protein n=1 Tax=Shinella sp. TaxID=1870904 RepID=UPI0028A767E7|nr:hypothetical protein [Shinella sp.]